MVNRRAFILSLGVFSLAGCVQTQFLAVDLSNFLTSVRKWREAGVSRITDRTLRFLTASMVTYQLNVEDLEDMTDTNMIEYTQDLYRVNRILIEKYFKIIDKIFCEDSKLSEFWGTAYVPNWSLDDFEVVNKRRFAKIANREDLREKLLIAKRELLENQSCP